MPRPRRHMFAGHCYHVLNRANHGARIFHDATDYRAFLRLMASANERLNLPILAACLMPNHFHLVVRPLADKDVGRWLQWLCTTHARHHHAKYATFGRVWQGRFKACLAQDDHYLLTLLRYVERNALRKNLVQRAEDWPWGSLHWRLHDRGPVVLTPPPITLPSNWSEWVNLPQTAAELEALRASVDRQRPFGDPDWVNEKAREAGLDQSLISVGRPRRNRQV